MGNTIFVEPGYHYQPYEDYFRLVELSGYPLISIGEMNPHEDATYILTMLNLDYYAEVGGWTTGRARVIYWDLEWRHKSYIGGVVPGIGEYWTSDRHYARRHGYQYVPLGSHPDLVKVNKEKRWTGRSLWDVCMLAYISARRMGLPERLTARRLRVAPTSAWGEDRRYQLEKSRCMVSTHQWDEFPCVSAQRVALAAAAGLPLVNETLADPGILKPDVHYISADMRDIPEAVVGMLGGLEASRVSDALHDLLCREYPFRRCVEMALSGVEVEA